MPTETKATSATKQFVRQTMLGDDKRAGWVYSAAQWMLLRSLPGVPHWMC